MGTTAGQLRTSAAARRRELEKKKPARFSSRRAEGWCGGASGTVRKDSLRAWAPASVKWRQEEDEEEKEEESYVFLSESRLR